MKNILKITSLAAIILQSPSTIGAEIDLLCTGVEILGHSKTPYSFRILVNVETEKFTIFEDASNWSTGRKEYPKDSSWNPENCPNPYWEVNISDTVAEITTSCSKADLAKLGGRTWEIKRTDGSFNLYSFGSGAGNGKCVKFAERVF